MRSQNQSDPASYWVLVVDNADISTFTTPFKASTTGNIVNKALPIRGVYCSVSGDAELEFTKEDGTTDSVMFAGLVAGAVYPFSPSKKTNSGGAVLIALYG